MFIPVFIQGLLLGFGLIVAIGAQNAFVLRQGLRNEHVGSVVAFCALADAVLITAGVMGMAQALGQNPDVARALALAGKTMEALRLLPADPGAALPPVLARVGILAASGQRDLAAKEASAAMAGRSVEERARLGGVAGHLWLDLGRFAEAAPLILTDTQRRAAAWVAVMCLVQVVAAAGLLARALRGRHQ